MLNFVISKNIYFNYNKINFRKYFAFKKVEWLSENTFTFGVFKMEYIFI